MDKINADRNQVRKESTELKAEKEKLKEGFYKALLEYEKQQIELKQIEWVQSMKDMVMEQEEQKRQWE